MLTVPNLSGVPDVTIGRVPPPAGFVGVQLLLYRLSPNPVASNDDVPTRAVDGRLVRRPRYPADLEFLFSFYGDETALEPQRLMGRVVSALHAEAVLPPQRVRQAILENQPALEGADLDAAAEPVRLTPVALEIEDMTRMWSAFYQAPYAPSIAYAASIVWLDAVALTSP